MFHSKKTTMKTTQLFIPVITSCLLFLASCANDPCESSLCMNGGTCLDGSCLCSDKYTGADCSEQSTPEKIRIRTIQLTRFPGMNNGELWDATNGPDLYFRLFEGDQAIAQPIIAFDDANETQSYYFFIDIIDLRNVLTEHTIQLRDYDAEDDDDIMGEVKFIPYYTTNGFPSKIVVDNGGSIAFTMEIDYIYNGQAAL